MELLKEMKILLDAVRKHAIDLVAKGGNNELAIIVNENLQNPLQVTVLFPFVSGKSLGINTSELIEIASCVLLSDMALRIADDCADKDNPYALYKRIGVGRSMNLVLLLTTISSNRFSANNELRKGYHSSLINVCIGQEYDMTKLPADLDEYTEIVSLKTIAAYRYAFLSGALSHTNDENTIDTLTQCGEHLGWMAQILDDIETLWKPLYNKEKLNTFTFPILYGLQLTHPKAITLRTLIQNPTPNSYEIYTVLDEMNLRHESMHIALDHRDQALQLLKDNFPKEGANMLKIILDWLFRDAQLLL